MAERGAYKRAIEALGRALISVKPSLQLSAKGAVATWEENLIDAADPAWFRAELDEGDGKELGGKFRAAHSSSALAVNNFARFKTAPRSLQIAGWSGFEKFRFEAKCSAGIKRRRSPNLDLLLCGASMIVGVESKCTEHMRRHRAEFAPAYFKEITDWRRKTSWFKLMEKLNGDDTTYRYLDAAQLVKHAFGLGHTFKGRTASLLYLYWEPSNADTFIELQQHRNEVEQFTSEVAGSNPSFKAMSYRELWDSWKGVQFPAWLPEHLATIRARYDVEI